MGELPLACPNCGEPLHHLHTDRQQAGKREIVLVWLICSACGHVALKEWWFAGPVAVQAEEQRPTPAAEP